MNKFFYILLILGFVVVSGCIHSNDSVVENNEVPELDSDDNLIEYLEEFPYEVSLDWLDENIAKTDKGGYLLKVSSNAYFGEMVYNENGFLFGITRADLSSDISVSVKNENIEISSTKDGNIYITVVDKNGDGIPEYRIVFDKQNPDNSYVEKVVNVQFERMSQEEIAKHRNDGTL